MYARGLNTLKQLKTYIYGEGDDSIISKDATLEEVPRLSQPVLSPYSWRNPPVSFEAMQEQTLSSNLTEKLKEKIEAAIQDQDIETLKEVFNVIERAGRWNEFNRLALFKQAIGSKNFFLAKIFLDRKPDLVGALLSEPIYLAMLAFFAAGSGDLSTVQSCLAWREYIDDHQWMNFSLAPILGQAAIEGRDNVVAFLLNDKGISPDEYINNETILDRVLQGRNDSNTHCIKLLTAKSSKASNELLNAIYDKKTQIVTQLLMDGVNPNRPYRGITPLACAVMCGQADMVRILLDNKADPDEETLNDKLEPSSAYRLAIEMDQSECVTLMTQKSREVVDFIKQALAQGDIQMIKYYLDHGFATRIEETGILKVAVQYHADAMYAGQSERAQAIEGIIDELLHIYHAEPDSTTTIDLESAYDLAIKLKDDIAIKQLLPKSVKVNTKAFEAVTNGQLEHLNFYIDYRFNVDATNAENYTLLQTAVLHGHVHILKNLLEKGVDPDFHAEGTLSALDLIRTHRNASPQHAACFKLLMHHTKQACIEMEHAAEEENIELMQQLIADGVNAHAVWANAILADNAKAVKGFLKGGFEGDTKIDGIGESALYFAREKKAVSCVRILTPSSKQAANQLYTAVIKNDFNQAQQLLQDGVDPDQVIEGQTFPLLQLARKNENAQTQGLVSLLTNYSQEAVSEVLIAIKKEGADLSKKIKTMQSFLEKGVNRNAVMLKALEKNDSNCVEILLGGGYDPDAVLQENQSARKIAKKISKHECVSLLTSQSKVAVLRLNEAIQRHDFNKADQWLANGVQPVSITANSLSHIKKFIYLLDDKQHPHLAEAIEKKIPEENIRLWRTCKDDSIDHPLIQDLAMEIETLKKSNEGEEKSRKAFIVALEDLLGDLRQAINQQRGKKKFNDKNTAARIAANTYTMLVQLRIPILKDQDEESSRLYRKNILLKYEHDCKKIKGWGKFCRILAMVCFGAVGFLACAVPGIALTAAIIGSAAFVLTAWNAMIVAPLLAVGVSSVAGSLGAFALSGGLLFKPRGLQKKAVEVALVGRQFVDNGLHMR